MSCHIPTDLLAEDDLPPPNAEWEAIARLALSFNGYAYSEKCGEIANAVAAAFARDHKVPGTLSLDDLRACLFFEQRRWRHFGEIPDEHAMAYIRRLIEATREQLSGRQS